MRSFVPLQYSSTTPNPSTGMSILSVPITVSLFVYLCIPRLNEIILEQSQVYSVVTDLFLDMKATEQLQC